MTSLIISLILDLIQNIKLIIQITKTDDLDVILPVLGNALDEISIICLNENIVNDDELNNRILEISVLLKEISFYVLSDYNIHI
jgi:hypothetical protein